MSFLVRRPVAGCGHQFADLVAKWDGRSYAAILSQGYQFDHGRHERIAFFPLFPLIGKAVVAVTGWAPMFALFVVAQAFLGGAFLLIGAYALRRGHSPSHVALAMAIWPPTMFFRMAYTESLFVFLVILFLFAIHLRWNVFAVAAVVTVATVTRSVGVALVPPLMLYAYTQTATLALRRRMVSALLVMPVALSGLLGFMAFQQVKYRDAMAFVRIQDFYRMRPRIGKRETFVKLVTLEPFAAAYNPASDGYWGKLSMSEHMPDAVFSIYFWNPIYLAGAVVATAAGGLWRVLNRYEIVLAVGLLLIPYLTRGYDFGMCSQARFTIVCAPVYLVLGTALANLPGWLTRSVTLLAGFHLAVLVVRQP